MRLALALALAVCALPHGAAGLEECLSGQELCAVPAPATIQAGVVLAPQPPAPTHSLLTADVDGDGRPDLLQCTSGTSTCGVYRNGAALPLRGNASYRSAANVAPVHFRQLVDVYLDGTADLVSCTASAVSWQMVHNASGDFEFNLTEQLIPGSVIVACGVGDVNLDGAPDLLYATADNKLHCYLNSRSSPVFSASTLVSSPGASVSQLSIGSINGTIAILKLNTVQVLELVACDPISPPQAPSCAPAATIASQVQGFFFWRRDDAQDPWIVHYGRGGLAVVTARALGNKTFAFALERPWQGPLLWAAGFRVGGRTHFALQDSQKNLHWLQPGESTGFVEAAHSTVAPSLQLLPGIAPAVGSLGSPPEPAVWLATSTSVVAVPLVAGTPGSCSAKGVCAAHASGSTSSSLIPGVDDLMLYAAAGGLAAILLVLLLICLCCRKGESGGGGGGAHRGKGKKATYAVGTRTQGVRGPPPSRAKPKRQARQKVDASAMASDLDAGWEVTRSALVVVPDSMERERYGLSYNATSEGQFGFTGKQMVRVRSCEYPDVMPDFVAEVNHLKKHSRPGHDNVVRLLGLSSIDMPYFMVLEYCANGSLAEFLANFYRNDVAVTHLDLLEVLPLTTDIANGLVWLSEKYIAHKALNSSNCFVSSNLTVKIGNLGLGCTPEFRKSYREHGDYKDAVRWMAPETLLDCNFSVRSDVYSFGVILLEALTYGRLPFEGYDCKTAVALIITGYRPDVPEAVCQAAFSVMEECWKTEPRSRIGIGAALHQLVQLLLLLNEGYAHGKRRLTSAAQERGYLSVEACVDDKPPACDSLSDDEGAYLS